MVRAEGPEGVGGVPGSRGGKYRAGKAGPMARGGKWGVKWRWRGYGLKGLLTGASGNWGGAGGANTHMLSVFPLFCGKETRVQIPPPASFSQWGGWGE